MVENYKDENSAFKFEGLKDVALDANYAFTITFAKKQFTITYKISQNGKLILNSDAQMIKLKSQPRVEKTVAGMFHIQILSTK